MAGQARGSLRLIHCFERSLGYHRTVYNRVWSVEGGLCLLNISIFLVTGEEDMPFHLLTREQEGSIADSSPDSVQRGKEES